MRVVVLGAGGLLGRDLVTCLADRHEVLGLTRNDADIIDLGALLRLIEPLRPEAIVNCGAATDVDRCEREPDWAYRVNAWGAWAAAATAEQCSARLVHVSTDFVFSGDADRPYHEWDAIGPVNVYGASKLAGEQAVFRACCRTSVVRTQWLYGRQGRSFPRAILNAAAKRPEAGLKVVADQVGSPTYTVHLARKLAWLLEWPADGLYHVSNAGECSRHAWACRLLQAAGMPEISIAPIASSDWPLPARRPARSTLRRYALELAGADDLPSWETGVDAFVAELRAAGELPG